MSKSQFIPVLAIALELCLATAGYAQNPPMNCTPDGIIEVCTLVNTDPPRTVVEAVAPPAPAVPLVTYVNGQLTITAENVPLRDVLREVSHKTGAALEVPNGGGTEPVFANIGPGSVREVMVTLLNGTKFNYVMLGSHTSNTLDKIVLSPAGQTTEPSESAASSSPAGLSSPNTQLPVTTAQAAAPESAEQKQADFEARLEARKQQLMPILRQRYADAMAKAAAHASADSPGSDSQPPQQ